MKDGFGREINYMRISITDRCNLHCRYCMPESRPFLPAEELLTAEEIIEIARAAITLGITRFKITGGEPLLRSDCAKIIAGIKALPGCEQVTLTTNGIALAARLPELLAAGIDAVNVSLDSPDPDRFRILTGLARSDSREKMPSCGNEKRSALECGKPEASLPGAETVLAGIRAARAAGLPVKVNAVLGEDSPAEDIEGLIALPKEGIDVRFIELMPIGSGDAIPGVSNGELLHQLMKRYPSMTPSDEIRGNGPAVYYRIPGVSGRIGFISAIHGPFCDRCNRVRVTADGRLKACLCYEGTADLKHILRSEKKQILRIEKKQIPGIEKTNEMLVGVLSGAILEKPKQHAFLTKDGVTERRGMSQIGG